MLWICNRPNCDRKKLFCSIPTSIASGAHSTAEQKWEKMTNQNTTSHFWHFHFDFKLTLSLFTVLLSPFPIPFTSPWMPFSCLLLVYPLRHWYRCISNWRVFAWRVTIRTLSISSNKSINLQEVCMLNWCCVCLWVCFECRRDWMLTIFPSFRRCWFLFPRRERKKTATSIPTNEICRLTNRMTANVSCFDYQVFSCFPFSPIDFELYNNFFSFSHT